MVLLEFPTKADVEAWFADPAYQEAMEFRHAASTMHMLLLQESATQAERPRSAPLILVSESGMEFEPQVFTPV